VPSASASTVWAGAVTAGMVVVRGVLYPGSRSFLG
jgi:hypothetical protein